MTKHMPIVYPSIIVLTVGLAAANPLIDEICQTIRDNYVFPDVADRTADHIGERARAGAYDALEGRDLAAALTRDLQSFTKDRHFSASALPEGWTPPDVDDEPPAPDPKAMAPWGVHKVERLPGNVGYLDLRGFLPAEFASEAIVSAVRLLQGSSAVVLDLRRNGGGDPETVRVLCSYFFDPATPVHLNSLYYRPTDETREFWTGPEFPDLAMPQVPLYVLTSAFTFSGGEECAYNFRTRERAILIGETTGGGAHPVGGFLIGNRIDLRVPTGRAINPVTNTNWEGVGVEPHVKVPAADALDTALEKVYTRLAEAGDERGRWGLIQITARRGGVAAEPGSLRRLAGAYTDREFELRDDRLVYRRIGAPTWRPLVQVGEHIFIIEGLDDFRFEFQHGPDGEVTGVEGVYMQGGRDRSARS